LHQKSVFAKQIFFKNKKAIEGGRLGDVASFLRNVELR